MSSKITEKLRSILYLIKNRLFPGTREYWEERYRQGGDSGVGSYGELAEFKANIINTFVRENDIDTVIEFGCGDGNQLSSFDFPHYIGFDVSRKAIELCAKRFYDDKSKRFFLYEPKRFEKDHPEFKAELTLSLDVIFHLIEDDIFELHMKHLLSSSKRYVIIYSNDVDTEQRYHVRHRCFSRWIETNLPEWKLIRKIDNKHPDISCADFYIYEKKA